MRPVFLLLLILGCINLASADQCYACDSGSKGTCGDPFDANSMTDQDKAPLSSGGVCVKVKSGQQVLRSFAPDSSACLGGTNGCKTQTEAGVTGTVCCCTSNLCNGVSTIRPQLLTTAFIIMGTFAMLVYRWF